MVKPPTGNPIRQPNSARSFSSPTAFTYVIRGTLAFVLLTVIAMFFYPGGTVTDRNTVGYSFLENFFSDLGLLVTSSGASNAVSAGLFFVACLIVGSALALFFFAFQQFFRQGRTQRKLSVIGSTFGILSGLCFVGVAFTPGDILLHAHERFAFWAFRLFTLAVLIYVIAIFRHPTYTRKYAWALVAFFGLQVVHLMLLFLGPNYRQTHAGMVIQATGQKIIVYASIISITLQAWGARRIALQEHPPHASNRAAAS
jgi:hypothetical membrane protein